MWMGNNFLVWTIQLEKPKASIDEIRRGQGERRLDNTLGKSFKVIDTKYTNTYWKQKTD